MRKKSKRSQSKWNRLRAKRGKNGDRKNEEKIEIFPVPKIFLEFIKKIIKEEVIHCNLINKGVSRSI